MKQQGLLGYTKGTGQGTSERPGKDWRGPLEDMARSIPRVLGGNASLAGETVKEGKGVG